MKNFVRPLRGGLSRPALCFSVLLFSLPIQAQTTADGPASGAGGKVLAVPRLDAEPLIDGRLDETVWDRAALVDDFHQINPFEYAEPSQRTEVRVFYTEDALYVGARMYEDDPSLITANVLRQGQGLPNDDTFNLMIDPYLDRRGGYLFEINANGVRVEGIYQNIANVDRNWEGIWQAQSHIDELGWTTEIRIPFQSISFDPASTSWGINFRRAIRRNNEDMGWISRNRQMNPSIAGTMTGMSGLRQGLGLDIVPYVVARQERVFGPQGGQEHRLEPQVDLFYKITPQLNAALTINTDFSSTEVDSRQVNLTRFSLFFPERRDFFVRDADIFEFGRIGSGPLFGQEGNDALPSSALQNGRPFFSRRIGLSRNGAPVDINAGAKLSGRIGAWNVGSLVVHQDEDPASGVDAQTVFVGRAALNVLRESQLGIIATHGNPQANIDNSVVGADFRYRNSSLPGGRTLESELWYQRSDTEGLSGDDAAFGFGLNLPNAQGWRGGYLYKQIQDNFNPALGFVNQRGIEDHAADAGYRHFLPRGSYVRSVYAGVDAYRNTDLDSGDVIRETRDLRMNANNNLGDTVSASIIRSREVLEGPFAIHRSPDGARTVTLAPGDYRFTQYEAGISTGGQRLVSGSATFTWGDYYEGNNFERAFGLGWRPSPRFNLNVDWSENEIHLPEGNFTVRLTSISSLINFSPMLSWSNRVQYDNVSEGIGINSRLRWIPEAGREAYLVLNWGLADLDRDNDFESINADLSLKFNYTFRF